MHGASKRRLFSSARASALITFALPLAAFAQSPDAGVWWESTVTMEMPGMPARPTSTKMCLPKKGTNEPPAPMIDNGDCVMEDVKRSKNKMTWKLRCPSQGTSGEGEMAYGEDSYEGTITTRTSGMTIPMKLKGKRVGGACDPEATQRAQAAKVEKQREMMANAQAQSDAYQASARAQMAQRCDDAVTQMDGFALKYECKDAKYKTRFCERFSTTEGFLLVGRHGEPAKSEAGAVCGKDAVAVQTALCSAEEKKLKKSPSESSLHFVGSVCPSVAKPIALKQCGGRSYTGMTGPYANFCMNHAPTLLEEAEDEGQTVPAGANKPAQPDPLKQGTDALKGLFGL